MKTTVSIGRALAAAGMLFLGACNDSKEIVETSGAPVIVFDSDSHVYTVKVNRDLLLEPEVINNQNATYRWLMNGVTVGREQTYLFNSQDTGEFFLAFEVTNPYDTVLEEVRIDVVEKQLPLISMAVPEGGFILQAGTSREFTPVVQNDGQATFAWYVDDEKAASTKDYIFTSDRVGEYTVRFRAENEDGSHEVQFGISVREAGDMPFTWEWEALEYNMTAGRTIVLSPVSVSNAFDATYVWQVNGTEAQRATSPGFSFTPSAPGIYLLAATMQNEYLALTETFTVNVYDNEDGYRRDITASSSTDATEVLEFRPAPGQYVNSYPGTLSGTPADMQQACDLALQRINDREYVSLGAFGGYIVVKFDHSIINDGGYNLQLLGNAFDGSSEPGIVWVMQDENGNGEPDDTWYELKGSEHRLPGTVYDYTVTYYKPEEADGMPCIWVDNLGNQGTVDANRYHSQPLYPGWITTDSYTLRGTRLEDRTVLLGANWYLGSFDWGYADNYGQDRLTDDENLQAGVSPNHFRISDAVDRNGNPVHLKYIDFVKVQTGVQAKAGWLGEVSTEVFGLRDYNMIKQK
ncbi:MAG: PKD domain-containing protein [Alistipes sp.]|nr:PKD domain-containing protein [Alistipes sp.]